MKVLWTITAFLGIGLAAIAETGSHGLTGGKARSIQDPATRSLGDAVNACLAGRPAVSPSQPISSQPSIQPISNPISYLVPKPEAGPFLREDPKKNPEFPGEAAFEKCLKGIPAIDFFHCPQVLSSCRVDVTKIGNKTVRPFSLDAGNPCNAGTEIYEMACGRGLSFDEVQGHVNCGPTQSVLAE